MGMGEGEEGTGSAIRDSDKLLMQLKPFCETLHSWCMVLLLQLSAGIQITYVHGIIFYSTESCMVPRASDSSVNRQT